MGTEQFCFLFFCLSTMPKPCHTVLTVSFMISCVVVHCVQIKARMKTIMKKISSIFILQSALRFHLCKKFDCERCVAL